MSVDYAYRIMYIHFTWYYTYMYLSINVYNYDDKVHTILAEYLVDDASTVYSLIHHIHCTCVYMYVRTIGNTSLVYYTCNQ